MPGTCWGSRNDPRSVPDMYLAGDQEMTLDLSLTCRVHAGDQEMTLDLSPRSVPDMHVRYMYMLGIKK